VNFTVSKDVQYAVMVARATGENTKMRVAAKSCKFFTVTKEGKLDPLDAAKATAMLKTRTPVLTSDSDVDTRGLDQIKPGTLCIVVPESAYGPDAPPPPPPPPQGKGT
jgi:hypothetical protein